MEGAASDKQRVPWNAVPSMAGMLWRSWNSAIVIRVRRVCVGGSYVRGRRRHASGRPRSRRQGRPPHPRPRSGFFWNNLFRRRNWPQTRPNRCRIGKRLSAPGKSSRPSWSARWMVKPAVGTPPAELRFFVNNFSFAPFTWREIRMWLQTNHTKAPPAGFGGAMRRSHAIAQKHASLDVFLRFFTPARVAPGL